MSDKVKHYWEYGEQDRETRRKYNTGDILENAAKCLKCGDYVRSNNRHDFKSCSCGNVTVDGGSWYVRRSVKDMSMYEERIVRYADAEEVAHGATSETV